MFGVNVYESRESQSSRESRASTCRDHHKGSFFADTSEHGIACFSLQDTSVQDPFHRYCNSIL